MTLALDVQSVSIRRGGLQILDSLDLEVEKGSVTGVIGPNGAGKTTLFNVVSGFMRPDAGVVLVEGEPITGLLPEKICARGLARTFQKVRGFPTLSVRENVLVGALHRNSVHSAAELVDQLLSGLGLDPYADVPAEVLPVGLRKRLEVARVLATEPNVVLLDEVMGGLVPTEVKEMMTFIRALPEQGVTVVFIEHHMEAVMTISDKVVVIDRGKNLAVGTPREVAANSAVVAAYLGEDYNSAQA
jgi:ABC-type branched-subunit amino acid transport system ATPase component